MRALVKKYPINCQQKYKEEVMLEPWPECVQADLPDFLDNYHYALCENCPDTPVIVDDEDIRMTVSHYTVEAYQYQPSEEEEPRTRYRAVFSA